MKLEIKHLAGYLPYKLKLIDDKPKVMNAFCGHSINWCSIEYAIKMQRKPILRPLSDLKKDDHFDLYMDFCEEMESISCEYLLEALINKTRYAFDLNKLGKLEEWMYKNHFDWKYGLIEKGLAIDINTIEPCQH